MRLLKGKLLSGMQDYLHWKGAENVMEYLRSSFITKYVPFGLSKRDAYYKLTDPFCIFYLKFVKDSKVQNEYYWQQNVNAPVINAWRSLAFENVCFNHITQIKMALGIASVNSTHSSWSKHNGVKDGTQVDLFIERDDNVVNVCEMKFYSSEFAVDRDYYHVLLITTYRLKYNEYSGIFTNVVLMEDLFK